MNGSKIYTTAEAFRAALEERAKRSRKENESLELARRKVSFEAFLLRIAPSGCPVVLKGGFALHLRYDTGVRPTKDLDAGIGGNTANLKPAQVEEQMRRMLETIASVTRDDFFSFTIGASTADLGLGREFVGFRFPVVARIGSRVFDSFHIDMSTGDAMIAPFDQLVVGHRFEFAGLPAGQVPTIRERQHFAEKLHAYCRPRGDKENSRVKDLFDMAFFIEQGVRPEHVAEVIGEVFRLCGNTPIPEHLAPPPDTWRQPFGEMAKENALSTTSMEKAFHAVARFYAEVLSSRF